MCRFLPFAVEKGVFLENKPINTEVLPTHQVLVDKNIITTTNKIVVHYHYVITNKSAKDIELILEHPKNDVSPTQQSTLLVDECAIGDGETKKVIDVRTEYVTANFYGLNFTVPAKSTTKLLLSAQKVTNNNELMT